MSINNLPIGGEATHEKIMEDFGFLKEYVDTLPTDRRLDYDWVLNSGIETSFIDDLVEKYNITVPVELREFYMFAYGATVGAYKILKIDEIVEAIDEMHRIYGNNSKDVILPFAYVIDTGDFIAFDLDRSDSDGLVILDGFHEFVPERWSPICFGLKNWLKKMVDNDFEPFWFDSK